MRFQRERVTGAVSTGRSIPVSIEAVGAATLGSRRLGDDAINGALGAGRVAGTGAEMGGGTIAVSDAATRGAFVATTTMSIAGGVSVSTRGRTASALPACHT